MQKTLHLANQLKVHEALSIFYEYYGLEPDGGDSKNEVKIVLFKNFNVYIPNSESRRKAVLKHDIHHMLTGYPATLKGELIISSWELGSKCWHVWIALVLNIYGFLLGLLLSPIQMWNAFYLGQHTYNLYQFNYTDQQLLEMTMGELKDALAFNTNLKKKNTIVVLFHFILTIVIGLILELITILLFPLLIIYNIYIYLQILFNK